MTGISLHGGVLRSALNLMLKPLLGTGTPRLLHQAWLKWCLPLAGVIRRKSLHTGVGQYGDDCL